MDHGGMDHGGMDMGHGGMDHGGMDMGGDQCSMNMIFTWSSQNMCIIFKQWRITGPLSLVMSLVAIVLLTAGYECFREIGRRYDQSHNARMAAFSVSASTESTPPGGLRSYLIVGRDSKEAVERTGKMVKALIYAVQVFYSFFIMLLFMTYNGWVMLAVGVGAFIGYLGFSSDLPPTKSAACH